MSIEQQVIANIQKNLTKYNISLDLNKLPFSGDIVETTLNDGTKELVDRAVEFILCARFPVYFVDRYGYTMDPKKGIIPFKLFNFQIDVLQDFGKHSKIIFRKCRQVGASVLSGVYALWKANFKKGQIIKIISLTKTDAYEFKEKSIDITYERLPGFLKTKTTRDGNNKTLLKLVNGSQIKILPKSKNAGRGSTPSLIIIDEAAFNEWMDDIWKAVEPALDHGGNIIVVSTTNGVGNWYHKTYMNAEKGLNEFHIIFIPWWMYPGRDNPWLDDILQKLKNKKINYQELNQFIKEEEKKQLSYVGDPLKAPYLWKKLHNSTSENVFKQEYLAEFLGSADTATPSDVLEELENNSVIPILQDKLPNKDYQSFYKGLYIFNEVNPDDQYVLTVDVGSGHGSDMSAFHVIKFTSQDGKYLQVAEYNGLISFHNYADLITSTAKYYNNAYVIVESNSLGIGLLEILRLKYSNIYLKKKKKTYVSFTTTSKNREIMVQMMVNDLTTKTLIIQSSRTIDELKTFVYNDKGKPEAIKGCHDDLVMSLAIFSYMKKYINFQPYSMEYRRIKINGQEAIDWEEKDEFYLENYGLTYGEYCWLQGKSTPKEYIKWKNKQKNLNF